jgi:hypothetical protein
MPDRGRDRQRIRNVGDPGAPEATPGSPGTSGHSQPVDAGKTSGGGNSGHDQPGDVAAQQRIRNQGATRDETSLRDRQPPEPPLEQKK